ncbi:MAG: response regulator [Myxococcota bacterium]|nr:response regulator [Myxococcota bacterium]
MRILLVEDFPEMRDLLEQVLSGKGHEVSAVDSGERALQVASGASFDLALLDIHLGAGMDGIETLVNLREKCDETQMKAVLISGIHDDSEVRVQLALANLGVETLLTKPLSMVDLVDLVEKLDGGSGAGQESGLALENARSLAAIWAHRRSGSLLLESSDGTSTIPIASGGLVDPGHWTSLLAGLEQGSFEFRDSEPSAAGDWVGMGSMLFGIVHAQSRLDFASQNLRSRLVAVDGATMAAQHPSFGILMGPLQVNDGESDLGSVLGQVGVSAPLASQPLHALHLLGLVDFEQVAKPVPGEPPVVPLPEPVDQQPSAPVRTNPVAERPTPSFGRSKPTRRRAVPRTDSARAGRSKSPINPAQELRNMVKRLEKEIQATDGQSPRVVLGVPESADSEMIDRAAARHRSRYQPLLTDSRLSPAERKNARVLLERIEQAHSELMTLSSHLAPPRPKPTKPKAQEELLLEQGRSLIADEQWDQADRVLSQAKNLRLDHAGILANLGWARFHNDRFEEEERVDEARDLLLLSEQFDPGHAEGQWYLAQLLHRQGKVQGALLRAARAVKARPDEPEVRRLFLQLKKLHSGASPGH